MVGILDEQRRVLEDINRAKLASIQSNRDDADTANRSLDSANALKGAWAGAADEVERAHRATQAVGQSDLSALNNQLQDARLAALALRNAL